MSQGAVEKILGKLVTDDAFRDRFFTDPAVVSFTAGLELSSAELDALSRLPKGALLQFSRWLDDRIRRLPLDRDQGRAAAGGLAAESGAPPAESHTVFGTAQCARTQGVGGSMVPPETLGTVGGSTNAREHPRDAGPTRKVTVHAKENSNEEASGIGGARSGVAGGGAERDRPGGPQ